MTQLLLSFVFVWVACDNFPSPTDRRWYGWGCSSFNTTCVALINFKGGFFCCRNSNMTPGKWSLKWRISCENQDIRYHSFLTWHLRFNHIFFGLCWVLVVLIGVQCFDVSGKKVKVFNSWPRMVEGHKGGCCSFPNASIFKLVKIQIFRYLSNFCCTNLITLPFVRKLWSFLQASASYLRGSLSSTYEVVDIVGELGGRTLGT